MPIKNAEEHVSRLDKIAEEIEAINPALAFQIDSISDVLEGRKDATTLKFDADEPFMQGRFNYKVQKRDADEPFMDEFNKCDMNQVNNVFQNPVPTRLSKQEIKHNREDSMIKNAHQFTESLDKIAEELEATHPALALQIDSISDVIEGRKEASTLKFDADEAAYMQGRFNSQVRKRDADEPYVDEFNKNNFEQVITVKRSPVPIKDVAPVATPYQKVEAPVSEGTEEAVE